jgi:hypothetical protein
MVSNTVGEWKHILYTPQYSPGEIQYDGDVENLSYLAYEPSSGTFATYRITAQTTVEASGDIIAFTGSDERLKDNLKEIENALLKIDQIGGYEFDWNNNQDTYEPGTHDIGVIAQEIEAILPDIVTTRSNGYKAVKYDRIVALLIQAIKEQQIQIDKLNQKFKE